MRHLLLAALLAFPLGLLGWIAVRALGHTPAELELSATSPAPSAAAARPATAPAATPAAVDSPLLQLLRAPLAGFRVDGELQRYDAQGLYDYIDGAAPVFLERGFVELAAAELASDDGGEATCDIYDMGRPGNAQAIYSKEQPAEVAWATFGDEGYRGNRALVFRRLRYYVKLTAFDQSAEDRLGELARLLIARIDGVDTAADAAPAAALDASDGTLIAEAPAVSRLDDQDARLRALLRPPLATARLDGEVVLYDARGLYDYIDGAAPMFLERGFRALAAAELAVGEAGELTCDIYDMQSSDNARAIYEKERPAAAHDTEVGDQAHLGSRALAFRRGPYYVKLTAFDDGAEAALPALAALLSSRVP